jgi:hypothetical protein
MEGVPERGTTSIYERIGKFKKRNIVGSPFIELIVAFHQPDILHKSHRFVTYGEDFD